MARVDDKVNYQQVFDKTRYKDNLGAEQIAPDLSRLVENGGGRYVEEAMFRIQAIFPGKHIVPRLTDGVYVVGWLKGGSVIRRGTAIVTETWDNAVSVQVGIPGNPALMVAAFDGSQAVNTTTVKDDCDTYIKTDTPVLMTIAGTSPTMKIGETVCLVEFSKLATQTYMPSN